MGKKSSLLHLHENGFWDSDMAEILEKDIPLRVEIGKHFHKIQGATGKCSCIRLST